MLVPEKNEKSGLKIIFRKIKVEISPKLEYIYMHICVYMVYVISDSKSFENFKQNQPKEIHTKVSIMDLMRGEKIMNTARNGGKNAPPIEENKLKMTTDL